MRKQLSMARYGDSTYILLPLATITIHSYSTYHALVCRSSLSPTCTVTHPQTQLHSGCPRQQGRRCSCWRVLTRQLVWAGFWREKISHNNTIHIAQELAVSQGNNTWHCTIVHIHVLYMLHMYCTCTCTIAKGNLIHGISESTKVLNSDRHIVQNLKYKMEGGAKSKTPKLENIIQREEQ